MTLTTFRTSVLRAEDTASAAPQELQKREAWGLT
jgi:hypothetical protein